MKTGTARREETTMNGTTPIQFIDNAFRIQQARRKAALANSLGPRDDFDPLPPFARQARPEPRQFVVARGGGMKMAA